MIKFNVLTRCSRLQNLETISYTVFDKEYDIDWHIIFDVSSLKDIPAELLGKLQSPNTFFHFVKSTGDDYLYPQMGEVASKLTDGFVVVVDDDNIIHPAFYREVSYGIITARKVDESKRIFVVDQEVDGKDFTGLLVREAKPENMKYQGVDIAQLVFHYSIFKDYNFIGHYAGDGLLIDKVFTEIPHAFCYINQKLCYYNFLERKPSPRLPRVLLLHDEDIKLKSYVAADYEDDRLIVQQIETDNNINEILSRFKPDSIVAIADDWTKFNNLSLQPLEIRNKWITLPEANDYTGEHAYQCAMQNILKNDNSELISYFTPIYNTGKVLYRTYKSLQEQTFDNWEWVIVNDSTDGGKTLKIAENIANSDPRVKVYDFREKSNGIIGESKYRAATLCKGYLIAELDHDDYLTRDCTELLHRASKQHSDIGFFYTDSAEINDNWESFTYADGFALGYGKYEKVDIDGHLIDSCISPNINPKTIRHIVGVPNHVRAWRKDIYNLIGGHNRGLAIADDYELIVRTFLHTKMMRIPKLCYLQYMHSSNTTDVSRKDIQRRVRTIMYYYNDKIAERFTALGVEDYVYKENKESPLNVESRFGSYENFVNETFIL